MTLVQSPYLKVRRDRFLGVFTARCYGLAPVPRPLRSPAQPSPHQQTQPASAPAAGLARFGPVTSEDSTASIDVSPDRAALTATFADLEVDLEKGAKSAGTRMVMPLTAGAQNAKITIYASGYALTDHGTARLSLTVNGRTVVKDFPAGTDADFVQPIELPVIAGAELGAEQADRGSSLHRIVARRDAQLAVDRLDLGLDRVAGEEQPLRDRASGSCCWNAATSCPARWTTGIRSRCSWTGSTSPRTPGSTATARFQPRGAGAAGHRARCDFLNAARNERPRSCHTMPSTAPRRRSGRRPPRKSRQCRARAGSRPPARSGHETPCHARGTREASGRS